MQRTVGIVGAGAAGAGAAYALRDAPVDVTVIEKSRGVSGRAATRRREGCRYDHGANYVKEHGPTAELLRELGADGLSRVSGPVWTFDGDGAVAESDDQEEKWTWETGIAQLAKRLFAAADAEVLRETSVASLVNEGRWLLLDADDRRYGPFDCILLTPPAPQTAALLAETGWQDERLVALREAVGSVPYRSIRSVVLHYPFAAERPWYALVNTDREHDVGWLSREECKPGRVPGGESLYVAQMSPDWSGERFDDPLDAVAGGVADRVAALVGDDRLRDPDWVDDARWRYALPDAGAAAEVIRRGEPDGLYFAGDWVVGEGRVHEALWNGIEAGKRIDAALVEHGGTADDTGVL